MSKYTAEQVLYAAQLEEDTYDGDLIIVQYLRDYAALLRERESAKAGVTDEMVECACDGFMRVRGIGMHLAWQSMTEETRISYRNAMRAALKAVAPMLATPCSLAEAFGVLENWSSRGNTLSGDDVERFVAIADRIAPRAASARAQDGWQLVPVEPTDGMVRVVYPLHWYDGPGHRLKVAYKQMLAAAPKPERSHTPAQDEWLANDPDMNEEGDR